MANYRRQTMAMNRLGQPEKWDFLKVYLLGWFNFWTMWMYYLFKKSKKKVNSKFFLKKILFPMSRCWQDSGFSCSYFLSNRCYPTPRLSYCAHLQDSEAKGHETWLQPWKWNHRRWEKWEKPFQFIKTWRTPLVFCASSTGYVPTVWPVKVYRNQGTSYFSWGRCWNSKRGSSLLGWADPLTAGRLVSVPAPCPPNVVMTPIHCDNPRCTRPHFQKSLPLTENHCEE